VGTLEHVIQYGVHNITCDAGKFGIFRVSDSCYEHQYICVDTEKRSGWRWKGDEGKLGKLPYQAVYGIQIFLI
jgi:hypothetical protein